MNTVVRTEQPRRAFLLDFGICLAAGLFINLYNWLVLSLPLSSLTALFIGSIISGFFIGLNSALRQERVVILEACQNDKSSSLPRRFFPMTRKFSLVAITTLILVALVLIMVFTRDVDWLIENAREVDAVSSAKMSVIFEIFFIMGVLLLLLMKLIFSYSKNLKLLFNNETRILEKVREGDLSSTVPVATNDEFGVIAGHTNHMIEGLRHRFELVNSLKLAEEVQQNLLPSKSPYLQRFDISGTSIYCDQTGGDYYDYILLPDNKLGIVVADVCGHGVSAAMLMTSVRAFLISAVHDYSDPAELLNRINKYISRDCSISGRFTSMFFLELNPDGSAMQWVRAGHDPPLYYRPRQKKFTKLNGTGLVLGVDESYVYTNSTTDDLQTGDIILVGTDGIHETRNHQNELFGTDRIQEIISAHSQEPARVIQENLVKEVREFRGENDQEDDITLVVIKVK